ncbi:MAG: tRNA pseudouridine(55) synthase TruB [Alphaproteobacteria bacterium]|nr:tRNA pseudouridine(55) synthase TruB [Alphaproteobacteria bacterium]MBN2675316.1 tRNA pseudouridine(55) synthase TruB [Alphaproteobacteria bacterium]
MDGWIILDKPEGMNSRKAGNILRNIFDVKTFGHIGTLDPMASGLLPIALGDATKMIPFWKDGQNKEYMFGVQWGFETDTLDITGQIFCDRLIIPTKKQVLDACKKLIGEADQIPPQYSAVHIGGQRAHKLARAGKIFEIPPRRVKIENLELLEIGEKSWIFRVVCSPGTYVRSIARDIAKLCGTLATVDMIRREKTNGLEIKDTVKLDFLESLVNNGGNFEEYLKSVDFGLGDIPVLNLDDKDVKLYKNGGFIEMAEAGDSGLIRVYSGDKFIGIGKSENGLLKPKRTIK